MEESKSSLKTLLECLLICSEKAANIARCCRAQEELFALLIQEKSVGQENSRFLQDFKTLADVLVQETIKHDLVNQFPALDGQIKGEESNMFTNQLGESICVQVAESQEQTSCLLAKVLNENHRVADLLAQTIFLDTELPVDQQELHQVQGDIDLTKVGIWIDPIDSTFEYIHGKYDGPNLPAVCESGLQCALVLIGAYDLESGIPILGVVNQPFNHWDETERRWTGQTYWGICVHNLRVTSLSSDPEMASTGTIVTSSLESSNLSPKLQKQFKVLYPAGAGYKMLLVALGLVDAYVLSKGSTNLWDTCGPHALLIALGGGIVGFGRALQASDISQSLNGLQLLYNRENENATDFDKWANRDGIIAYRDQASLQNVLNVLREA